MARTQRALLLAITLILMALFVDTAAWSQGTSANRLADEITKVLKDQQMAWNDADIPSFMKGYWSSPELSFSGSSGVFRGWKAVLDRYQRSYPDKAAMGQLDFSDLEFHALGDSAAMVLGKWHLKRSSGDVGGVFTLVFQKFPDGWKIIHDHTSQVLKPAP
jgi:ketosteroid isomerase-like protein